MAENFARGSTLGVEVDVRQLMDSLAVNGYGFYYYRIHSSNGSLPSTVDAGYGALTIIALAHSRIVAFYDVLCSENGGWWTRRYTMKKIDGTWFPWNIIYSINY